MGAANTYGVTASTLQGRVSDLTISAASSPSSSDVTYIIADEAETLRGMSSSRGITTDGMTSADPAYSILKGILVYRAVGVVLRARGRGELADSWSKQAEFDWRRLIDMPQTVDANATADLVETVEQWSTRTGYANGNDTFAITGAGRIINGGSL